MTVVGSETVIGGRFRVIAPAGSGGMATVYRAIDHQRRRVGELLAEMCGNPVSSPCDEVAKAKRDPRRLGEEIAIAFLELLRAETKARPVMLVLEDIHWADPASLRLVERALRELHERPLFVVALSRPLMDDKLWAGHALRLPLKPLSRKACERLVNQVLGTTVTAEVVARIIEQAAGNALFLEELIRAVAEGRRELPSTVLAMLQSRISKLSPDLRRVLRTASVFGARFRRDGIAALLSDEPVHRADLDVWLAELVRLEIIEPQHDLFAFRHALVVDAAYGLLTGEDRRSAHLAAAAYLDVEGGHEAIELADHYQRADAPELAVPCFVRAGLEANGMGDMQAARTHFAEASDALRGLPDRPEHRRTRIDILLQQVSMSVMTEVADLNLARVMQARELLETVDRDDSDRHRELMLDFLSARVYTYSGNLTDARIGCERVISIARELGDDKLVSSATQALGNVTLMQGNVRDALPLLAPGAAQVEHVASEYDRLRFMGNYAMALTMAGRYREAMAVHDHALAYATASSNSSGLAVALAMRAFSERCAGDPAVLGTIEVAREHTLRSNERLLYYLLVRHHAWVEGVAGRPDAAREHLEEARAVADELGGKAPYDDMFIGGDAQAALVNGDVDGAIAACAEAVPQLRDEGSRSVMAWQSKCGASRSPPRAPLMPRCISPPPARSSSVRASAWPRRGSTSSGLASRVRVVMRRVPIRCVHRPRLSTPRRVHSRCSRCSMAEASVRVLLLAGLLACGDDKPKKQPPAPRPAVAAVKSIVGPSGPVEMMPSDGAPLLPLTLDGYAKEFAGKTSVVVATQFPPGLSKLAGAGVNFFARGKNVSWVIDGEPSRGFALAFDENANGDLRDDPKHSFKKVGDAWELMLTLEMQAMFSDEPVPTPARIRFRNGELRMQSAAVRRGTLPLPKAPMQFALVGEGGQFGLDHHYIAFDLDRDGKVDVEALDNPELFHVFEKTITIDDMSYAFEVGADGGQLGLRPLKDKLPPRPPLSTGTPAPDFAVTDLDGKPASLSGLRGKIVLVDFWATSCAPCVRALPRLAALRAKYHAKGFELLSVAAPSDEVREVLGAHRAGIASIDEPAQAAYRVDRYPMQFLVGRDGNILCSRCQLDRVEQLLAENLE